ncbi:MAG: hypothetical protein K0M50_08705 [Prolixibacteraceae bacterium]|nr:hypothetical protein [Prolixibacteraceae bacterium]
MKMPAKLLEVLPESYLIVLVLLSGFNPPFSVHPLVLIIAGIVALQLIFRNAITGIMLANSFILINLYMILAMLSELSEFPTFNSAAAKLLVVGSLIILTNLFIAGLMFFNYYKKA